MKDPNDRKVPMDLMEKRLELDPARKIVLEHLVQSAAITRRTSKDALDAIVRAAGSIERCFREGHKLLICGNGGSAADAQHLAAEFMNRLNSTYERPGLPAIALTTDSSFLTAYANDYGYEGVFERQVATLGNSGDILLAISTSGNSQNVIKAVTAAHERGLVTIGLIGDGGALTSLVDQALIVPSRDTQHLQESFLAIEHAMCLVVEAALFSRPGNELKESGGSSRAS